MTIKGAGFPQVPGQGPVGKERFRLFRNQRPGFSGGCVDLDYSVRLMATLIVFKCEAPTVFPPSRLGQAVRVRKQAVIDYRLLPRLGVEEHGTCYIDRISRFGIFAVRML